MGNTKSVPNKTHIAAANNRQSQQIVSESIQKLPEVNEQEQRWKLSERDVAFLGAQSGKSE